MLLALFRGASLSADRSHIAVGVTWAVTRHGIEAMLVLAVLEFGLELGFIELSPTAPIRASQHFRPQCAAPRRALSGLKRRPMG